MAFLSNDTSDAIRRVALVNTINRMQASIRSAEESWHLAEVRVATHKGEMVASTTKLTQQADDLRGRELQPSELIEAVGRFNKEEEVQAGITKALHGAQSELDAAQQQIDLFEKHRAEAESALAALLPKRTTEGT